MGWVMLRRRCGIEPLLNLICTAHASMRPVETYTRMEKMQLTEDVVKSITGSVMEVTNKKTRRKALQTGDIRIIAEITAKVDTQDIERSLREKGKKRATLAERYKSLQQAIAKQERENDELKQKIAELKAKALPVQDLQIEAKVKEREFLSNQKVDEGIPYDDRGDYDTAIKRMEGSYNRRNNVEHLKRGITHEHLL